MIKNPTVPAFGLFSWSRPLPVYDGREFPADQTRIRMSAMNPRLRIVLLLTLCLSLFLPGCSLLEKQKLPFLPRSEAALWVDSLSGLSGVEQGKKAEAMWKNTSASPALRERALSIAGSRPGKQGFAARKELNAVYMKAAAPQRAAWESMFWADLDGMDNDSLKALASAVSSRQEMQFPWNLVLLKAARKGLAEDNAGVLARLSSPLLYAAPAALGLSVPAPSAEGSVFAALVLPQSGSASALGRQIAAGALAAADALRASGRQADIRIIDTAQPGWQQQLQALPPQFVMIGGPLLRGQVKAVENAAAGRALFTFTTSLPSGEEGSKAWRFFASPQDQIRTLLDAAGDMGITSFGIFSPEDKYSKRMSGLFMQEASARGYTVTSGSYTAGKMNAWPKEAGTFVKMRVGAQRGSIPTATADFRAIFLPDSWKNMDMLVSSLHYSGAQDRLMMGTSLWEQSLGPNSRSNAATFALTVFPGVWNDRASGSGAVAFRNAMTARGARADDWSVLGFDFVQTAAALALLPGWTPSELNRRLSSGPDVDWAGAPMRWDASGLARRQLFLLRPASTGHEPADIANMKERLANGGDISETPEVPAAPQRPLNFDQLVNSITKD